MANRNANIAVAIQNSAGPQLNAMASEVSALVGQLRAASIAAGQTEAQFLSLAGALSRDALAAGDAARADRILADANRGLVVATQQSAQAHVQHTNATQQAGRGTQDLTSNLRGLQTAFGSLGIAFGVKQIIDFGVESGKAALQLRETKNALRAVAGDATTYNQILASARQQQLLFGGSLQDNIEGLSGLAVTSRNTGANLAQLIDLQKRLTVLNPAQGAQGGLIALNEALAGNIASLSRRFNIPRAALQELNDTTKPVTERLKVLDQFLTNVGITSAAVTGKVDANALAFRRLSQELGDARLNAGDQLATSFSGAATGLARLVGVINQNPQAIAELRALFAGKPTVNQADIDQAANEIARRQATASLFSGTGGGRGGSRAGLTQQLGGTENILRVEDALTRLQLAGDEAAGAGGRLTAAFKDGQIPLVSYLSGLDALVAREAGSVDMEDRRAIQLARLSDAQSDAADKLRQLSAEIDKSAQASILDAARKDAQQARTALLAAQAKQTLDAFLRLNPAIDASGIASLVAAGKIDTQTAALIGLRVQALDSARALLQFSLAQGALSQSASAQAAAAGQHLGGGPTIGAAGLGAGAGGSTSTQVLDQANRLRQSQFQLRLAQATTAAQRIAILKEELNLTTDQVTKNGILAQIASEQNSSAKAHTGELNKQLNLEERIRDSKEKQYAAQLDIAELIIKDRQDRRKEDQELERNARIQRSGRASQLFKDAAADSSALIEIERQKRALAISEKGATAGGAIINGRIYQSRQTGTAPTIGPIPVPGAAPAVSGIPGGIGVAGGGGGLTVQLVVDGRVIAQQILPDVIATLRGGLNASQSAGAGR